MAKVTKSEIDRAGLLDAAIKSWSLELNELKAKFKEEMEESMTMEGDGYVVSTSKAPTSEVHGTVDYRLELIAAIGVKKVKALEAEAYEEVTTTTGTPRMTFRQIIDPKALAKSSKSGK